MNRFFFSALVATLAVFSSLAQTPLDEVVVSSPRLDVSFSDDSKSVTVITAEQIADTPVSNLVDLLRFQAGIDIRRQGIEGAQADVYLRGGTFDQVLLLIDGIRVDDPQTGHHTLNSALPLEVIERIEIVKGPAARIYGQNALTGAINIVTKKERVRPVSSEVDRLLCDNSKLLKHTPWKPKHSLQKGLQEVIRWMNDSNNISNYKPDVYSV